MGGLPNGSFLGTDATSWFLHHVPNVTSRCQAVELGQVELCVVVAAADAASGGAKHSNRLCYANLQLSRTINSKFA